MEFNVRNIVSSIALAITIVTGVFTIDARYATSEDLKHTEIQLVQTLERFKSDMVQDRLQQRYITLTDQAMQLKILMKKNPSDMELKEDYNIIEQERQEVKKKLEDKR